MILENFPSVTLVNSFYYSPIIALTLFYNLFLLFWRQIMKYGNTTQLFDAIFEKAMIS